MVKITYIDSAGTTRTVEGEAGSTVMETAINHGVPEIEAECGGACACATCHVYVNDGWFEKLRFQYTTSSSNLQKKLGVS
jgi:2Fe-2S ferredoxin